MSGESTPRTAVGVEDLERTFGEAATCNRCGKSVAAYRVIATFLHDTAAVRAYCAVCYPDVAGEYWAYGSGFLIGYEEFARRFGAPGPAPPPATPVDRGLIALMREPGLRTLVPPSETLARRTGKAPYHFEVVFDFDNIVSNMGLVVTAEGRLQDFNGHMKTAAHIAAILEFSARG
jgi:hypothetical protein